MTRNVVVIEPDLRFRESIEDHFSHRGYAIAVHESLNGLAKKLYSRIDLAVIDVGIGHDMQFLKNIRERNPGVRVVLLTRYPSVAGAVRAMKLGAHDYLIKPVSARTVEQALLHDRVLSNDATTHEIEEAFPSLARQERDYIEHVLELSGGNISEAARCLGIHRQSLQRKLRKYPPSR